MSEDLTNEELVDQLGNAIQQIENLKYNQKGLIEENQEMRNELNSQQSAAPLIYKKMLEIKKDLGHVGKDQKNAGQGWMFRGIDQFLNALKPLLDKHGVGMLPNFANGAPPEFVKNEKTGKSSKVTTIVMKYTFFAEDGSSLDISIPAEGVDFGDKGTNKALSAALKYGLIQTFSIPTEDIAEGDRDNVSFNDGAKPAKKSGGAKVNKAKSFSRKDLQVVNNSATDIDL